MMHTLSPTKILTRAEIAAVLASLAGARGKNVRMNRIIFRLATCCGLRATEIAQLRMRDIREMGARSHLIVRSKLKRGQNRTVPLWWDRATMEDLLAWHEHRTAEGGGPMDWCVCTQSVRCPGRRLHRNGVRARFLSACKILGPERVENLTVHHGRHTFGTFAVLAHPLASVRDVMGHGTISTTSLYLHVPTGDDDEPGDLFALKDHAQKGTES